MRLRMTLAGQFLALQLVIVLVVVLGVAAVSLAQSAATFERIEGRRVLAVAESVAATPLVRLGQDDRATREALAALADGAQSVSGASFVMITSPDRTILTAPDPRQIGGRLPLGGSSVLQGRSWTGVLAVDGTAAVVAHVPVIDDDQRVVGIVAVGRDYPTVWERLRDATPNLITYVGLASLLGVAGSWLLARRVKRQTLGLEPREITGLVEHREAMLHGIKEGVVSLDPAHRISLVNDGARELLNLPEDCVGRTLEELQVDRRLYDVLTGGAVGSDQVVVVGERVLTLNRMPMSSHGTVIGSVTTLRDRTELVSLQRELGTTRNTTDTLRAQTHEFTNQLHTISGLIQLGEYGEVVRFVNTLSQMRARLSEDVTSRIADPALAALLIAKSSLASERGAGLRISETSRLPRVDERLSADLTTVVGNLVDNALDAIGPVPGGWVEVHLREDGGVVHLVVRDSGPGVAPELAEEVFRHGFTTKAAAHDGQRGFGLALTQLVCSRRGGEVTVHNDEGAVFTAQIPTGEGVAR